ncbi:MAG: hypothetical protein CM15mP105_0670 [Methanobacteriota archaeon]|nr:MAG: hypothetical protein CM15mP105_0670 [Euryarchaeota archaeon]
MATVTLVSNADFPQSKSAYPLTAFGSDARSSSTVSDMSITQRERRTVSVLFGYPVLLCTLKACQGCENSRPCILGVVVAARLMGVWERPGENSIEGSYTEWSSGWGRV